MSARGTSETFTSPTQRCSLLSKRTQACQRCWRRKQKCDRSLPRCTSCAELNVECVTRVQDIESLLSDDAGLTHASIHSYVETLRVRTTELGNGASQSPPAKRQRTMSEHTPGSLSAVSARASHAAPAGTPSVTEEQPPAAEDAAVRDTMGAIGFLSNSAMAETRSSLHEPAPHKMALADLILSALAVAGHDPSSSDCSQPGVLMDHHQIPISREASMGHYERFLKWSFFLPYLDHVQLSNHFESTIAYHEEKNGSPPPLLQRFTVYVIIATGIMMSEDASRLSTLAASLHATAVKMLPYILRDQTPLSALHCMALLISFSLFSPNGGSAWHLVGIAVKVCISLGLHKEALSPVSGGVIEEYDARWLFWTLYNFDRMLCSTMDRPFGIRDGDITVQIPTTIDTPGGQEPSEQERLKLASSRHVIRQAQLMSNIRCSIGADPIIAYHGLCFWRDSIPIVRGLPFSTSYWAKSLDQMACRLAVQIVSPLQQQQSATGPLRGTAAEVESDTIQLCIGFIDTMYKQSDTDQLGSSFVDAYDILAAAIVLICLHRRLDRQEPQHFASLMNSINRAATIVTQIAARFTALRTFQETLLELSSYMMDSQYNADQVSKQLRSISTTIPRRLRKFLSSTFG